MGEFRSLVFLFIGLVVGWSASRYSGGLPRISIAASTAEAADPVPQSEEPGVCTGGPAPAAARPADPPVSPSLQAQMEKLKIADLDRLCTEVEEKYLAAKLAENGRAIAELAPNERDVQYAEWDRRFSDLRRNSGSYWKSRFTVESGADVITVEVLLGLNPEDDSSKCTAWSVYTEINGRPLDGSLASFTACSGSGFHKKGDHFFWSYDTYHLPGLGKHMTFLLLPMPGGGGAEYLSGETEKWMPISQFSWQRSSIIEHSQLVQRFQARIDQLGGP